MRILSSARKHGVADDDIWHALRNYVALYPDEGWVDIYIGAARDGTMLEIGVTWDNDPRIIHAMKARSKYWPPRGTR